MKCNWSVSTTLTLLSGMDALCASLPPSVCVNPPQNVLTSHKCWHWQIAALPRFRASTMQTTIFWFWEQIMVPLQTDPLSSPLSGTRCEFCNPVLFAIDIKMSAVHTRCTRSDFMCELNVYLKHTVHRVCLTLLTPSTGACKRSWSHNQTAPEQKRALFITPDY